ncbi:MAG: PGF-CTERM sorting domain-containing protein, partial [Candidatus Heimdallarchaeota archaeon]|nr:PGF-CTERM sorting domain-containing protein [Candidatus Heimdallarchaeota archaeon]
SFEVPFHNSTTIFLETGEVNHATSPNISDINFNTNRLTDEKGVIREIIAITNISIYNPNSVAFSMRELYYQVSVKKNESSRQLNNIYSGIHISNQIINPMDTYVHSTESRITDNDTIQYFTNEETKYIKVKGSAFLISNETGWSPAYFEPRFNTIITIKGTDVDEEVVPNTEQSSIPGFGVIYAIAGLLAITCLLRRRG